MIFFVRSQQESTSLGNSVTGVVRAIEPEAPVRVSTLDTAIGNTIARPRAISILLGVFALVALALAAIGVYGVMAYSVRARTQEIGIRMALGATAPQVFRLVLGQALRLVTSGVVVGLAAAAALTRVLERLLFEVEPLDSWTFAVTALVLLVVATVASCVPARRSMRLAPVDALRTN
jgi:ABC-type antimicrobial peptide transport system permease subunit